QVEEKGTGRYLRVDTKGFPFVLLWSKPGIPDFVCIEPWMGYPGPGHDLMGRPGAMELAPGASFSRTQRITVGV
ncbi:MAG TPA: aldose 1-epimerase family protein, partial [Candidatus Flavonifractor merdigallinarum]|nr:aldose 1-epimerase family protein [Candidatus Flavonifractor merdigallinarum]